jgi:hypothetical protein
MDASAKAVAVTERCFALEVGRLIRDSSRTMWIITALFVASLFLAHVAIGMPQALRMHISEMRRLTPFGHVLFLLVIAGALCFARRAQRERHDLSAVFGVFIALSIFVAWLTPTLSHAHDFFASAPFVLLYIYIPLMLLHGGHFLVASLILVVPPICDLLLWLAVGGSSGEIQKTNALLLLGLLNFVYYKVLPSTDPLLHPPYLEGRKPRSTKLQEISDKI